MSLIRQSCLTAGCGHADYEHKGGECSYGWCAAGRHQPTLGPAEVVPTFDMNGEPVGRVLEPGSKLAGPVRTSDSEECMYVFGGGGL